MNKVARAAGFTLLELLITVAIAGLLMAGLSRLVVTSMNSAAETHRQNNLQAQAHLAMRRMVESVQGGRRLLVPQQDDVRTASINESYRRGLYPVPSGWINSAVLAVSLDSYSDLDFQNGADRDNDLDGRVDEDAPADWNYDLAPGLWNLDDDGDGNIDDGKDNDDDDEDGDSDEDWLDGVDNDGDGRVDEDPGADSQNNNCPGLCGVDDDNDDLIDEYFVAGNDNDDEDNENSEDWLDLRVFYLSANELIERTPTPWINSSLSYRSGRDFQEEIIAENVIELIFERKNMGNSTELLRIALTLQNAEGERVALGTTVRVGTRGS